MKQTIELLNQIDEQLKQKRQQVWEEYLKSRYLWDKQQGIIRYWPTQKEAEEDDAMYKRIFGA